MQVDKRDDLFHILLGALDIHDDVVLIDTVGTFTSEAREFSTQFTGRESRCTLHTCQFHQRHCVLKERHIIRSHTVFEAEGEDVILGIRSHIDVYILRKTILVDILEVHKARHEFTGGDGTEVTIVVRLSDSRFDRFDLRLSEFIFLRRTLGDIEGLMRCIEILFSDADNLIF